MKQEEQEMLETQSIPLRNYLMRHVMPTLTQGLIEVCKVKPDDAVDYLVRWNKGDVCALMFGCTCNCGTANNHYAHSVSPPSIIVG